MILKVDTRSLEGLNRVITKQLDEFLLTMNGLLVAQKQIETHWNDEQYGSFSDTMRKIIGAKDCIESSIIQIRDLIAEMLTSAEKYNRG